MLGCPEMLRTNSFPIAGACGQSLIAPIRALSGDAEMFTALIQIDESTLTMTDAGTGECMDAVAVIPGYAPDLAKLVNMLTPDEARTLEQLAALRALGMEVQPLA